MVTLLQKPVEIIQGAVRGWAIREDTALLHGVEEGLMIFSTNVTQELEVSLDSLQIKTNATCALSDKIRIDPCGWGLTVTRQCGQQIFHT